MQMADTEFRHQMYITDLRLEYVKKLAIYCSVIEHVELPLTISASQDMFGSGLRRIQSVQV